MYRLLQLNEVPPRLLLIYLAQIPPCDVRVNTTVKMWRHTAHRLNQVKVTLLVVTISDDDVYHPGDDNVDQGIKELKHSINTLKLVNVSIEASCIKNGLVELSMTQCRISNMTS